MKLLDDYTRVKEALLNAFHCGYSWLNIDHNTRDTWTEGEDGVAWADCEKEKPVIYSEQMGGVSRYEYDNFIMFKLHFSTGEDGLMIFNKDLEISKGEFAEKFGDF